MKKSCFLLVILCLVSNGALATYRFNAGEGSWLDGAMWDKGVPPLTTTEELKITRANNICHVSSNIGVYTAAPRVSVANAESTPAKIVIEENGNLSVGEFRVGAGGATGEGSVGIAEQTGGSLSVNDVYVGRYGGSAAPIQGSYTISGGTLTFNSGANGRLYVGAGNGGGYVEGTFTVVGSASTIQLATLYVGSDGTNSGKGTIKFQVDPAGVTPIMLSSRIYLDSVGASSTTQLEVTATGATTPAGDIVLINCTSSNALAGTFDTLNGGSAAEGTEIIIGGNLYKLTYAYAADGGTQNDIALKFVINVNDLAHGPTPANNATVETSLASLSWINPDPNRPDGIITCDVYLGKDPNRPQMNKKTLAAGVSSVAINTTNFPTYGALTNKTRYYWVVDVHDTSDPNVLYGLMWSFYTDNNDPPSVNAGLDQTVWLGKSGTPGQEVVALSGTATDDGLPNPPAKMTYSWTQVDNGAPTVAPVPNNTLNTSVTITARGTYEFMLTASDSEKQSLNTVQVIVGINPCDASHMMSGAPAYNTADQNQDCLVDIDDLKALIVDNWLHCTDTLDNCGN